MNRFALFTFLTLFLLAGTGYAQTGGPASGRDLSTEELKPLVDLIKKNVVVLNKPLFVYHYFDAKGADPVWRSKMSANDPIGYRLISQNADGYWRHQGSAEDGNTMGPGLYAALDPVSTRRFGGEDDYVLVRIELPLGTRVLDLVDFRTVVPDDVAAIYESLGCKWREGASSIFRPIASLFEPKPNSSRYCIDVLRGIVDRDLGVDALTYGYSSTHFKECTVEPSSTRESTLMAGFRVRPDRMSAVVIMSNRWLKPEHVRIFNQHTTDSREERLRIQSMFYKNTADVAARPEYRASMLESLPRLAIPKIYPGMRVVGPRETEQIDGSVRAVLHICPADVSLFDHDESKCRKVPEPAMSHFDYPATISVKLPTLGGNVNGNLMWRDLEGQPAAPDLGEYIQRTQLGCADELPWKAAYP